MPTKEGERKPYPKQQEYIAMVQSERDKHGLNLKALFRTIERENLKTKKTNIDNADNKIIGKIIEFFTPNKTVEQTTPKANKKNSQQPANPKENKPKEKRNKNNKLPHGTTAALLFMLSTGFFLPSCEKNNPPEKPPSQTETPLKILTSEQQKTQETERLNNRFSFLSDELKNPSTEKENNLLIEALAAKDLSTITEDHLMAVFKAANKTIKFPYWRNFYVREITVRDPKFLELYQKIIINSFAKAKTGAPGAINNQEFLQNQLKTLFSLYYSSFDVIYTLKNQKVYTIKNYHNNSLWHDMVAGFVGVSYSSNSESFNYFQLAKIAKESQLNKKETKVIADAIRTYANETNYNLKIYDQFNANADRIEKNIK